MLLSESKCCDVYWNENGKRPGYRVTIRSITIRERTGLRLKPEILFDGADDDIAGPIPGDFGDLSSLEQSLRSYVFRVRGGTEITIKWLTA